MGEQNRIVLTKDYGIIGTSSNPICGFGRNKAKYTLPETQEEEECEVFLEVQEGPVRLVLIHQGDGVEIIYKGQRLFLPKDQSLLILTPIPDSSYGL
jgi:hypothetical protein